MTSREIGGHQDSSADRNRCHGYEDAAIFGRLGIDGRAAEPPDPCNFASNLRPCTR